MNPDSGFRYGYNTNGFSFHRLDDALEILAELGYRAVALTLDVHHLDPFRSSTAQIERIAKRLRALNFECAIETGARFVLDGRRKHWPTLIDSDPSARARRVDYLQRCVAIGEQLGAHLVSFWSGVLPSDVESDDGWKMLGDQVAAFLERNRHATTRPCFEPEPGMLVSSMSDFARLRGMPGCEDLKLALDVGHVYCTEAEPAEAVIDTWSHALQQVTLDDTHQRRHEHLPPGEGDADWRQVLGTLKRVRWTQPLFIELGRHGHAAVETARSALRYLKRVEAGLP